MEIDLSIIILSYNTSDLTQKCILRLISNLKKSILSYEIIAVDNASKDGSLKMLQVLSKEVQELKVIANKKNLGFAKGNNVALRKAKGQYVLYLNSDVMVENLDFREVKEYLDRQPEVAGLTVNVVLKDGSIDPASHRGFPSPWNSIAYFSGLERLTYHLPILNRVFGGYHLAHLDLKTIHEIDSPTGAFFLVRKSILDRLKGLDEDFFFYGEDIDLAYRIKKLGYKIIYYPKYKVTHLKYSSGLKQNNRETQTKTRIHFYEAMKIFYKKHYEKMYPVIFNKIMYGSIDLLKIING